MHFLDLSPNKKIDFRMKPLMKVQSSETIHLFIRTFVSQPYNEWAYFYIYI